MKRQKFELPVLSCQRYRRTEELSVFRFQFVARSCRGAWKGARVARAALPAGHHPPHSEMIPPETILHAQSSVGIATLNATAKFGLSPDGERVVSRELSVGSCQMSVLSCQLSVFSCPLRCRWSRGGRMPVLAPMTGCVSREGRRRGMTSRAQTTACRSQCLLHRKDTPGKRIRI